MRKRKARPVPAKIAAAQAQFEKWRQGPRPGSRIPEDLWAAAVDAAEAHGVHQVTRSCRLSYAVLKQHLEEKRSAVSQRQEMGPDFVEVMAPLGGLATHWSVEIRGRSGDTFRVEIQGAAQPDVMALLQGFWGHAR